jgi:hypothetical protein
VKYSYGLITTLVTPQKGKKKKKKLELKNLLRFDEMIASSNRHHSLVGLFSSSFKKNKMRK